VEAESKANHPDGRKVVCGSVLRRRFDLNATLHLLTASKRATLLASPNASCHWRALLAVMNGHATINGMDVCPDLGAPAAMARLSQRQSTTVAAGINDDSVTPQRQGWADIGLGAALAALRPSEKSALLASGTIGFGGAWSDLSDLHRLTLEKFPSCGPFTSNECCGLGAYLKRWKTARDTPAADVVRLLDANGLRRVVLLGDSVGDQYMLAFQQALRRDGVECHYDWSDKSHITGDMAEFGRRVPWARSAVLVWFVCGPVKFLWHPLRYPSTWLNTSGDVLSALTGDFAGGVDLISFNTGLHYREDTIAKTLEYVLPLMQRFGAQRGKMAIFRETTAQHFEGISGSYEQRDKATLHHRCGDVPAKLNRFQTALRDVVPAKYPDIVIEPLWEVTRDRGDMHLVVNSKQTLDCTHFCYNSLFWEGVFSNLFTTLSVAVSSTVMSNSTA